MNFMVVFLINLAVVGLSMHFIGKKIVLTDFVNRKHKCYYYKDIESMDLTPNEIAMVEIKDGKGRFFNEYSKFLEFGVLVPILILLSSWPFLYYMPNHWIGYAMLSVIFFHWYQLLIVYLRFRTNKSFEVLDENFPYTINYTMFPFNMNRLSIINMGVYVFVVLSTDSLIAVVILALLFIKMNVFIFMDKVDKLFGWNCIKKKNLMLISQTEKYLFFVIFFAAFYIIFLSNFNPFF